MLNPLTAIALHVAASQASDQTRVVGGWLFLPSATRCGIAGTYGAEKERRLIAFVTDEAPETLGLSISSRDWSVVVDADYDATFYFDGAPVHAKAVGVANSGGASRGLLTTFNIAAIDALASAEELSVYAGSKLIGEVPLPGSATVIREMRKCIAALPSVVGARAREVDAARRRKRDPFSEIAPAPPAIAARESWITQDDYPPSALRAHEEGVVRYSYRINPQGRVEGCTVTRSSGSKALDQATCSALTRRGRFTPGLDSTSPDALHEGSMTWALPE